MLFVLLVTLTELAFGTESAPKVVADYGVLLRTDKAVTVYNSTDVVAFTVSIRKPEVGVPRVIELAYETIVAMDTVDAYDDVNRCYSRWLSLVSRLQKAMNTTEEIVNLEVESNDILTEILERNDLAATNKSKKPKRSIEELVSGLGGFMMGSEGSKVENVRNFIRKEVPILKRNLDVQLKVNEETVHEVQLIASFFNKEAAVETCDSDMLRYYIDKVQDCEKYQKILEQSGKMDGMGVPRAISSEGLANIVGHQAFDDTVFKNHALLLRKYGQLQLERTHFNEDGSHLYYLLAFPRISHKAIYPGFSIAQTGFVVGKHCFKLVLPDKMVSISNDLYEANCETYFSGICKLKTDAVKLSCLSNRNPSSCKGVSVPCKEEATFINTKGGLLINSNDSVSGFINSPSGYRQAIDISPSKHSTFFVSWGKYSAAIMPDGLEIKAPADVDYLAHEVIDIDLHYSPNNITESRSLRLNTEAYAIYTSKRMTEQKQSIDNLSSSLAILNKPQKWKIGDFFQKIALYFHVAEVALLIYFFYRIVLCCNDICICKCRPRAEQPAP